MNLVVDTGVLLAAADEGETHHAACASLLVANVGGLHVPAPVVAETAWMIERVLGPHAEATFLRSIVADELTVIDLDHHRYERCIELIERYADLGLGLADASVITVAEDLGIADLATLNHRDFRVVRPRHVDAFRLLPPI